MLKKGSKHVGKGVSRQFGNSHSTGTKSHSGQPKKDKLRSKQMKDASNGRQRYHLRQGK